MNELIDAVLVLGKFFKNTIFIWGVISGIFAIYLAIRGIIPILYRLGSGLAKRKIAIFANDEDLKKLLIDSGIFKDKNIELITKGAIDKAKDISLMLVKYQDFKDRFDDILEQKKDSDALLIYAPIAEGRIDNEVLEKIEKKRNSIIVNFRGRLINDIFVAMMTTGYSKN